MLQKDEENVEKKLLGDSVQDCNYCDCKNHLEKKCMTRKMHEKKENTTNEVYYTQKIEELQKYKSTRKALIVEEDDGDERVKV